MKKAELYAFKRGLESVGDLVGIKFAYAIAKNLRRISAEIKLFDKATAPSEEFTEYERKRIALAAEHSETDERGRPIVMALPSGENSYQIVDMPLFQTDLLEIRAGHEKAISDREDQMRRHEEFLDEESELRLYQIPLDTVPHKISAAQMTAIWPIIKDEEDEEELEPPPAIQSELLDPSPSKKPPKKPSKKKSLA